jgi:micrococcal nuclease
MTSNAPLPRSPDQPWWRSHGRSLMALLSWVAIAAGAAACAAQPTTPSGPVAIARVIRVVDGDTLVAVGNDSIIFRVRLHGIDAPECGMPFGPEAQRYLESLVLGMTVQLVSKRPDRYRRLVASMTVGEQDVGRTMLDAGLAWHDERMHKPRREIGWRVYRDAQQQAQIRALGLWTQQSPTPPWLWRRANPTSPIRVTCSGPVSATTWPQRTATLPVQERP